MKKKHKLLKHAYDNYPKGVKFKSIESGVEIISNGKFIINGDNRVLHIGEKNVGFGVISSVVNCELVWAEIIEKPKSILDGKVAISVQNEREFQLLMKHYEEKGWKDKSDIGSVNYIEGVCWKYENGYSWASSDYWTKEGYTIIQFADFASEVGIEVPVFIMKSEDGVDLYEGDDSFVPQQEFDKNKILQGIKYRSVIKFEVGRYILTNKDNSPRFSTLEAAEKWIAQQNKPKEIEIKLFGQFAKALINNNNIKFINGDFSCSISYLSHSDIEAIYNAIQQLKGGDNA